MIRCQIRVIHQVGLHARPAYQFVAKAAQFQSSIRVRNVTTNSGWVDAKSILGVLTLGVESNHHIELETDGEDASLAANALTELVKANFPL